ncbi:MAG: organic solvent tolerance protein OstA [Treponema sp.]|nr:organic solvent tolerance protein OstA [Treponema sp.]
MKHSVLILLGMLFISSSLFAEKITFRADRMTGSTKKSGDVTVLTGNAIIKTEDMELSADSLELSGKDFRNIKATGNISGKIISSQMDFTCQEMTYDRETKIARLQNSVHLIDHQNNVDADADLIDYNQNTEVAVLQIGVSIIQKENHCTAAYALYKKNDQTLTLTGNPQVTQGENTFRAQEIVLNLDTQEITLDGRVRGSVTTEENKAQPEQDSQASESAEAKNGQ